MHHCQVAAVEARGEGEALSELRGVMIATLDQKGQNVKKGDLKPWQAEAPWADQQQEKLWPHFFQENLASDQEKADMGAMQVVVWVSPSISLLIWPVSCQPVTSGGF